MRNIMTKAGGGGLATGSAGLTYGLIGAAVVVVIIGIILIRQGSKQP